MKICTEKYLLPGMWFLQTPTHIVWKNQKEIIVNHKSFITDNRDIVLYISERQKDRKTERTD